jgi:hypothetical protein
MTGTLSESRQELLVRPRRGGANSTAASQGIVRRSRDVEVPVSPGQQEIWRHSQDSTQATIYNEMVTISYFGELERIVFERTFTEIIRRHEAWRTTFELKEGELLQRINAAPEHIEIPYIDIAALPAQTREEAALRIARADALAPYDLAVGPLYRPRLIRYSEEEHRLFLGLHHIIFDGVSLYRVLLPELEVLYEAFSRNLPSPLPDLPLQYADYALWHRRWVEEIAPGQLEYWRSKLRGTADRDILPLDYPRAGTQSYRGAAEILALDPALSDAVKALCHHAGMTLFMALLASFHVLIWAYSREDDLIIGCTSSGRSRTETHQMLGFFLNTVALRTNLSGDPTFLEVIQRGREELLSSLDNDGIPFEQLVKTLCIERDNGRHPFFQVLFAFQPPLAPLKPSWKFSHMDVDLGVAKFDLHVELDERPEGIIGRFIYNADLFDRSTIVGMLGTWKEIVRQSVRDPSRRISQLVPELIELRRIPHENGFTPEIRAESSAGKPSSLLRTLQRFIRP